MFQLFPIRLCHYKYSNRQYDERALDSVCELSSQTPLAASLGGQKFGFLKQQYKQMMPEPLKSHPAFAVSTNCMHFFISSSSDRRKLLEFRMLFKSHLIVTTCKSSIFFILFVHVIQCFCYYLYSLISFFNLYYNIATEHYVTALSAAVLIKRWCHKKSTLVMKNPLLSWNLLWDLEKKENFPEKVS